MKAIAVVRAQDSVVVRLGWVSLFAVLTGAAAWIRFPLPFTPVPITLQTMVVLGSGVILGSDAIFSQILYLVLGGIGLPLFASNLPNVQALFGPTGGYLVGFVAAAAVSSLWIRPAWERTRYGVRVLKLAVASLVLFVPGILQLAFFLKISIPQAVLFGFVPFIVGDLLKILATAAIPKRILR